jgi:hypothetical protein
MPDQIDDRIEKLLAESASTLTFPSTPDLAGRWQSGARAREIDLPHSRRSGRGGRYRWGLRAFAAAAAVVLVVTVTAAFAQRSVRDAVADFLGLAVEGERIEHITPGSARTPFPSPFALESFATPIGPAEAQATPGRQPLRPPGEQLAVFRVRYAERSAIVLQYGTFDLWQMPLDDPGFIGKLIDGTVVQQVEVDGDPAYWLSGGIRLVSYFDASGTEVTGSQRGAETNTLVWSADGIYYRIEGYLTIDEALAIAISLE